MEALAVDLQLLRSLMLPELKLLPGRALMARVVDIDAAGRGTLSLAGALLEAELPKHLQAGQEVRLLVRDVTPDRVVLGLAPHQAPIPPVPTPLPGGGTIHVSERETTTKGGPGGPASHTIMI